MFLTMFKKNKTLCSRCILAMFLVKNIFNKLKFAINTMKFATNCDKSAFFNNLLTNTHMVTIVYYKSMNIVNPNHF